MTETEYFLNKQITIYLMVLKISPNLKGYSYLKSGTLKIIDDLTKKEMSTTGFIANYLKNIMLKKN